ncbi:MAG TPA: diguanylate cyclase [Spirochaetales bacterium]|nr:diguanylate cyclase [Spirochaetales bacterium]
MHVLTTNDTRFQAVDSANARAWDILSAQPQSALEEAERALATASEAGYAKGVADAHLNIGWSMYYLTHLPEAYRAFLEVHREYLALGDVLGVCKTLNALGVYHYSIFRLEKAVDYFTQSLEVAKANGIEDRELIVGINIGELCLLLGNPQDALEYLIPAYVRMIGVLPPSNVADCLRNIGKAFLRLDNPALAAEYIRRSYSLAKDVGESIMATDSVETLADVAIESGEYDEAERLVREGLELVDVTGNSGQRVGLLIVEGTLLNARGRHGEALGPLKRAEELSESLNLKSRLFKVHEQMSEVYRALGDYERALDYYKKFSDFRQLVQHEDTANKLRGFQAQVDIERAQQEAEIYRLRNIDLKEKTEALENINRQITSISRIGQRITASLDYGTVVQTLYDCLKPFIDIDMFGIALSDPGRGQLVYKRYYEDGVRKSDWRINLATDSSFTVWAFRNNKPVLITDKENEYGQYLTRRPSSKGRPSQSIVCMPLSIEEKTIGVMTIQNYEPRAYAPSDLSFLQALAPYVSIAVENALIHDRLEVLNRALSDEKRRLERATLKISHLANHDTLTGLPNRRLLVELMDKSVETARRTGSKIGVVFMDLDDFKPINDQFGHTAGDSALVAMADRIRGLVRASDIVARIGGDEFLAIITNIQHRDDVERVARKVIEECGTPLTFSGASWKVGVSIGIALFPDDGESIEDLVNRADSAMYRVKHMSKNAYSFWGDSA